MMDTVSNPSGGPWAGVGLACALGFLGFAVGRQYEKRNNTTKGRTVATEEASAAKNGDSNCGGGATTRSSAGEGDAATPSGALKTAPFGSSKKVANILRSESENVPNLNEMQKLGEGGPGDKEQEATPVANTFLGREITTDDDVPSSKTLPLTKSGNMIVPHSPLSRHRSLSRTSSNAHDLLNAISETTQTAINSSEMTEEKNREHSFLLYSLYGTYFYPGYLYNRFSERRNHHDKLEKLATLLGKKYLEAQRLLQQVALREELLSSYHSPNESKWLAYTAEDILDPRLWSVLQRLKLRHGDFTVPGWGESRSSTSSVGRPSILKNELVQRTRLTVKGAANAGNAQQHSPLSSKWKPLTCVEEIAEEVYKFPTLKPEICTELCHEIELFLEWQEQMMQSKMPGAELLNTKLCVIDHINVIGPHVLDLLKKHVADPLLTILYPQVAQNTTYHGDLLHYNPARSDRVDGVNYASSGMAADDDDLYGTPPSSPCEAGNSLRNDDLAPTDYRYGFSIGYANANRDKANGSRNISRVGLDCHTDDSEVSLTIRLGREYEGGEVGLRWKIGDKFEGEEQCLIKQKNGEGTLFYGQQFHEVHPVTSGERQMLVVWFRGEKTFRANTCPCCRMHRRHDTNCVLCFDARIKGTRSRSGSQDACELDESARGPTLDEKLRRSATQ